MYKLNKHEENVLKIIIKYARIDYFKNNNMYFDTEDIDNLEIKSDTNLEREVISKYETKIPANEIENFFTEENIYKITKALTYNEKLVLFLFYVEGKSDKEIAKVLGTTWEGIKSKRKRIIKKIRMKIGMEENNV